MTQAGSRAVDPWRIGEAKHLCILCLRCFACVCPFDSFPTSWSRKTKEDGCSEAAHHHLETASFLKEVLVPVDMSKSSGRKRVYHSGKCCETTASRTVYTRVNCKLYLIHKFLQMNTLVTHLSMENCRHLLNVLSKQNQFANVSRCTDYAYH